MTNVLEVFVQEVMKGGTVKWESGTNKVQSSIQVVCCCVDAPARAAVLNQKQYNGYNGCSFCLHQGKRNNNSVKYIVPEDGDQPDERGTSEVMKDMSAALSTSQIQRGVRGYTPLVLLPKFDLVWGVVP
ncbi:hypothetical protein HPB48_011952 [Haemaphysalis longicornis]|uniref:Uncharacterized protein n=1 Tax=Haemaphysalis longicornis TaxID=44386 RepID=A0A9J6GBM4_HAELO|nr:hypothetical protein HPB48_011952 [Haemaphysalis longicornis]